MVFNLDVSAIRRSDVKIKNYGLGEYGAEPHYSETLPFWQLCALKG